MKKPDEILIRKFIENRCSESEYKLMMDYLTSLDNSELNAFMDFHINQVEAAARSRNDLYEDNIDSILAKITSVNEQKSTRHRRSAYLIAASIAFFLFLSTGILYYSGVFNEKKLETIWNENTTEMGQKFSLTLPDGTNITLNGDGKLKYPQKFAQSSRDVYLEGEAFFEVAHDSAKPFIVHTGTISTIVVGTKFNVSAFTSEKDIVVSLVEGKVKVSTEGPNVLKGIIVLEPEQQLVYDKEKEESKIEGFDQQKATGWKENILKFEKEPLGEIFKKLERTYGVKYELEDKSFSSLLITANFNKASLWTVNETLKKLTDLKYRIESNKNNIKTVVFYKNKLKKK
jgi:transmembrane sensor